MKRHDAIRRVFILTLALNLVVAFSKIALGAATGALAITADGFHSLTDGASNVTGIVASTLAKRPPDDDHPYGHRRYETLAALLIAGFLLLLAWEIVTQAVGRISGDSAPDLTPLTFVVLFGTLAVNIGVTTYQSREGRRLKSELLIADSAHTRADVYVTVSVIISMAVIALTGWGWVDLVAAAVVVVLIGRAAWAIVNQSGRVLVDTAPYSGDELREIVGDVPAVESIIRARSRGTPDAAHIDIDVRVSPAMTAAQTAAIAGTIRERLHDGLDGVGEVEVHFAPCEVAPTNYAMVARAVADAHGLGSHEVRLIVDDSRRVLDLHVEVPAGQTLAEAHEAVSAMEHDLRDRLPDLTDVVTHIEPAQAVAGITSPLDEMIQRSIKRDVSSILNRRFPAVDWHHIRVYAAADGLTLTLHAAIDRTLSVSEAHHLAEAAETLIRAELPQFTRVTIHTEPADTA